MIEIIAIITIIGAVVYGLFAILASLGIALAAYIAYVGAALVIIGMPALALVYLFDL